MNDVAVLCRLIAPLERVEPLAGAFAARALVAAGETAAASALLRALLAEATDERQRPDWQLAAVLWALGEDFEALDPGAREAGLAAARRLLPDLLAHRWDETAAYGALYGALRALASHSPVLEPARRLKDLSESILRQATFGGRLAARLHGDTVDPCLLLLVPFGLFGPEDLQMVATVQAIEAEGVVGDAAAAWLAWYYRVKGTHPRRLAELRAVLTGDSLWAVTGRLLLTGADGAGIVVHHVPTGHDHPYHHYTPERIPRDPVAGRPVELRATVTGDVTALRLEWQHNAALAATYSPPHWQEEGYWSARLGPFEPRARIRYRWVAVAARGGASEGEPSPDTESEHPGEWHEFGVLTENGIRRAVGLSQQPDGTLTVTCLSRLGTRTPRLTIGPAEAGTLRVKLDFADATPTGGIASGEGPTGEYRVGDYRVVLESDPFHLTVLDSGGRLLMEDYPAGAWTWWEDPSGQVQAVERCTTLEQGERLYGTGERFDRLERRGTTVVNTVYNQYKDQGDRTYMPVPLLLSSRGYGLWVDTDRVGALDLGQGRSDRLRLTFRAGSLETRLIPGPSLPEVLDRFTSLTGRPVLPPRWAFGPWMSSHNWGSQAEVERQVQLTEKHDIPASVLVIEQWSDEATFCLFNDAQYTPKPAGEAFSYGDFTFPAWGRWTDPRRMVDELHRQGIRVLLWQIPVWKHLGGVRHQQHDLVESYLTEQGYVVKMADGSPYRIPDGWFVGSLLIDFTNPAAAQWWLEQRRYLLDEVGFDGFKTDGGEFIWDREAVFADGTGGESGRNLYVNQYVGATHRFVQERTGGQGVTFSRAGYTGAQQFPMHWAGDAPSTWPALRGSLVAGLNAGLAGIPFWGFDVAGFSGDIPTAELFCRNAAFACFCPVMQYHAESEAQYNQDRTPWNIADRTGRPEVIDAYRRFAHLRLNLMPYIFSQAVESSRTGVPMMRPLVLVHPEDEACAAVQDEYYFGADLLVAPVLEAGALGRDVYLPSGEWFDFWTGRPLRGPATVWCAADWDQIPVFVRAGAVIPLNLSETGRLGEGMRNQDAEETRHLHLHVYAGEGPLEGTWWSDPAQPVTLKGRWEGRAFHLSTTGLVTPAEIHVWPPAGLAGEGRETLAPGGACTLHFGY